MIRGQAKRIVGRKELNGLVVCGVAGHDVVRDAGPGAAGSGLQLFGQSLEQRLSRDRSDGIHAFGMREPQTGALPSGDQDNSHPSRSQCLFPDFASLCPLAGVGVAFFGDQIPRHAGAMGAAVVGFLNLAAGQRCQLREVDCLNLLDERLALAGIHVKVPVQSR